MWQLPVANPANLAIARMPMRDSTLPWRRFGPAP